MKMIELEECLNWLKEGSFKKVCLQIPDHLLADSAQIVVHLQENSEAFFFIVGDTTYENCCNDKLSADHVQADACIHFGHACLSCTNDLPTFYIFPKQNFDCQIFCQEFQKYFEDATKRILLFYDISFAYIIEHVYEQLKLKYKNFIISTLSCTSNVPYIATPKNEHSNSILGRWYNLPADHKIESYDAVYLGSNDKTLMVLSMSIPVNIWHWFNGLNFNEYSVLNSLWLKRRNYLVEKIKDAHVFGIVIASLNIKDYLKITEMLKQILKKMNKKIYLFNVGKITPTKLANFQEIDIFVAVTCPESSLIDSRDYFKPIVTPFEVDLAFNSGRTYSMYHAIDFKQLLPGGSNYEEFQISSKTDVSLTCGKLRSLEDTNLTNENSALAEKSLGTMANTQIDSTFLQSRSWSGLEQKLGESSVSLAVDGRVGIPTNYQNEQL